MSVETIHRRVDPAAGGERLYHDSTVGVEARYDRELRPGLETTVRLDYVDTDVAGRFTSFDSYLTRLDATLRWEASGRYHLIVGAEYAPSTIRLAVETPPPPSEPPPRPPDPPPCPPSRRPVVAEDADRRVLGFTL